MKQTLILPAVVALLLGTACVGTVSAKATPSTPQQTIIPAAASAPKHAKTYIVITSAKATAVQVIKRHTERMWLLGKLQDADVYQGLILYHVTVTGFLKEQVGNKPNPATDPGVKNSVVTCAVETGYRNWGSGGKDWILRQTAEARTPWWDGTGSFTFSTGGQFDTGGINSPRPSDYPDPVPLRPDAWRYTVDYPGYTWWGVPYDSTSTGSELPVTYTVKHIKEPGA